MQIILFNGDSESKLKSPDTLFSVSKRLKKMIKRKPDLIGFDKERGYLIRMASVNKTRKPNVLGIAAYLISVTASFALGWLLG